MSEPVDHAEIDYQRHDPYLQVIVEHTKSVGDAMARTTLTAGQVIRSSAANDLPAAQEALADVEGCSRSFLAALARASCPVYLKGAVSVRSRLGGSMRPVRPRLALRFVAKRSPGPPRTALLLLWLVVRDSTTRSPGGGVIP